MNSLCVLYKRSSKPAGLQTENGQQESLSSPAVRHRKQPSLCLHVKCAFVAGPESNRHSPCRGAHTGSNPLDRNSMGAMLFQPPDEIGDCLAVSLVGSAEVRSKLALG